MQCPYCAATIPGDSVVCPQCSVSVEDGLPMKWYRFLVGPGLWIAGAVTLILGILTMVGIPYLIQGYAPGTIYDNFPPLVVMDFAYGLILLALAAMFIVARFRLADFRKSGPRLVCIAYVLVILASVIYSAASGRVASGGTAPLITLTEISSILGMIAGVTLNVIYFKKRTHLFFR